MTSPLTLPTENAIVDVNGSNWRKRRLALVEVYRAYGIEQTPAFRRVKSAQNIAQFREACRVNVIHMRLV